MPTLQFTVPKLFTMGALCYREIGAGGPISWGPQSFILQIIIEDDSSQNRFDILAANMVRICFF